MNQEIINYNGKMFPKDTGLFPASFRGHKYGDGLFETLRVINGKVIFLEDHYFRLMASMRMVRMDIPMEYTMQFIENEIIKTVRKNGLEQARVRFSVYRSGGGHYTPDVNSVIFTVEAAPMPVTKRETYTIELFKDYYISSDLLSTVKTTCKMINVVAAIFADEHGYDNCLLLNEHKNIVETINGNVFLVSDKVIKTPPLSEGCIKGIMRKKVMGWVERSEDLIIEEAPVSPFELLKAQEIFITNAIIGVQPVTNYRKKVYGTAVGSRIRRGIMSLD